VIWENHQEISRSSYKKNVAFIKKKKDDHIIIMNHQLEEELSEYPWDPQAREAN